MFFRACRYFRGWGFVGCIVCCVVILYLFYEPRYNVCITGLSYDVASLCFGESLCCCSSSLEPHEKFPDCGVGFL